MYIDRFCPLPNLRESNKLHSFQCVKLTQSWLQCRLLVTCMANAVQLWYWPVCKLNWTGELIDLLNVKHYCLLCSWCSNVRGMEAEWSANSPCDWQWNNARLFTFPFPDQWATAYCSTELSRIHHWRAWRQQWYGIITSYLFKTGFTSHIHW